VWLSLHAIRAWGEAQGLELPAQDQLPLVPELRLALRQALHAANLMTPTHYERVRRVALVHEPATLERGELTPTLKIVRTAVLERHADLVSALQSRKADPRILELGGRTE
jgi:long-chain acyl-CoA synthetase